MTSIREAAYGVVGASGPTGLHWNREDPARLARALMIRRHQEMRALMR
jgi:hypothetical protein